MNAKMLINAVDAEEYRVAILKDNLLDAFYVETSTAEQKIGNIYKGVVERVVPSLQACFVNFGDGKNGFLSASEIHPEYFQVPPESFSEGSVPPIEKIVKRGQELLVQVTKEMPGRKGAQMTTYLSIASRYLVLRPGGSGGISKKIEEDGERQRLKSIMNQLKKPEGLGTIVRTAAMRQNKKAISRDLNRLVRMWKAIRKRAQSASSLNVIHKEQDICLRTLRDYFNSEITEILVDEKETFHKAKGYLKVISPRHQRRVKLYKENLPIFDYYDVEKQIESVYSSEVSLGSGGYIVIDPTEALISVDVNSGRTKMGRDVESAAYRTNREAAKEVARQLRLRDMGGLVVIDFIDMKERKHIREIEKIFREETKKDAAKIDLSHISKFGLLELSRQRLRPSIESRSFQPCHYCQGRGLIMSVESASVSFLRRIWMGVSRKDVVKVNGTLSLEVATYLQNRKRKELAEVESRYHVEIDLKGNPQLAPGGGELEFIKGEKGGQAVSSK